MVKINQTTYQRDYINSYLPAGYTATETQTLQIYYPEGPTPDEGWPYHIHWFFGGFTELNLFSNTTITKNLGLPFELLERGVAVVLPGCTGSNIGGTTPNPITGGGFFRPTTSSLWTDVNYRWYYKDAVLAGQFLAKNAESLSLKTGSSGRTCFGRSAGAATATVNGLAPDYSGFGHDDTHRVAGFIAQSMQWYWESWAQSPVWQTPPFPSTELGSTQCGRLGLAPDGFQDAASCGVFGFDNSTIRGLNANVRSLLYHPSDLMSTSLAFTGSLATDDYLPPTNIISTAEAHPSIMGVWGSKVMKENGGQSRLLLAETPFLELAASGAPTGTLVDKVVPDKTESFGFTTESAENIVLAEQIAFVLSTIGSGYYGSNVSQRLLLLYTEDELTDLLA